MPTKTAEAIDRLIARMVTQYGEPLLEAAVEQLLTMQGANDAVLADDMQPTSAESPPPASKIPVDKPIRED